MGWASAFTSNWTADTESQETFDIHQKREYDRRKQRRKTIECTHHQFTNVTARLKRNDGGQ